MKGRLYARSRIAEYWLIDVNAECVDVFRLPEDEAYAEVQRVARGSRIAPIAFPDVALAVDDLFA